MPEGDTIFRTARTLRAALAGKVVRRSSIPGLAGVTVTGVESMGKNLLIHFDSGSTLHSHLRLRGSWHIYRHGERWRKSRHLARAVIETDDFAAVCFQAPVLRLIETRAVQHDRSLATLGPDLLAPAFSTDEILQRFRKHQQLEIGVAIMRQHILAGIGNVYKSEILFLENIPPRAAVSTLPEETLQRIIHRGSVLLRRNLVEGERRTRPSLGRERLWAYGRAGKPCFHCGTTIQMIHQGADRRLTFYCPACQKEMPAARTP